MRYARRMIAALPLLLSGCGLISGACIYETRAVTAEGRVVENGTEIARGLINVGGTRDAINNRSLSWDVTAVPLDGHIISVAFTDAARPGVVILELPFLTQFQPATIRGVLDQKDNAPTPALGGIFEIVADNRAVLEVRTDLPSRPVVRIPHTVTMLENWSRPNCS
jgi:hypothetical protein